MCISILPAYMYMYYMHALLRGSEEGAGCPGIEVIDNSEPPCWCWELNLDLLGEQLVHLTPEPSL